MANKEITKGEANRQCYLQGEKQPNSDCFLCPYEKKCWKGEKNNERLDGKQ